MFRTHHPRVTDGFGGLTFRVSGRLCHRLPVALQVSGGQHVLVVIAEGGLGRRARVGDSGSPQKLTDEGRISTAYNKTRQDVRTTFVVSAFNKTRQEARTTFSVSAFNKTRQEVRTTFSESAFNKTRRDVRTTVSVSAFNKTRRDARVSVSAFNKRTTAFSVSAFNKTRRDVRVSVFAFNKTRRDARTTFYSLSAVRLQQDKARRENNSFRVRVQ